LTSNVFPFDGSYVGRLLVNCTDKPSEILTKLNKLAGYEPGEEIALYEVGLCCLIYYLSSEAICFAIKFRRHTLHKKIMFRSDKLRY